MTKLHLNQQLPVHEGPGFTTFNNFRCISSNKHPGTNYFKLWLEGRALIGRKSLIGGEDDYSIGRGVSVLASYVDLAHKSAT